ncbi:pyridoxal phosphate enzyme, YggS family [Desulfocapsa sulfexigens DSM 10523]|uniref:Pyridoxal phosphate homeostasis protein n=1 Tax=Desulfocapsa sulfexigens (strain DSM 10523 / SB164P1) TaxID=1167006 RepID=M1PRY4_DESSD|nr:YggS family pyridoxal phosphate-dependent enzyme [Desulfocapsa sulfexigens]AGF79116.1 pyridoxal phosphate enzyme, YggS family [Desulfocapsa sulfexigens DSM 10523]
MSIANNLNTIHQSINQTALACDRAPSSIKLIAVSKRHSIASIKEAMAAGQYYFGENYIQEAAEKRHSIDDAAKFHFIGHVQSNKAKLAAELFSMVETVDRLKLAKALNKHLLTLDRKLDILIQVNIGEDPKKSGVPPENAGALLKHIRTLSQIRPMGLMTIPPFSSDTEKTRIYFRDLSNLGKELAKQELFSDNSRFELSMGMSQDFKTAIEEGATIIRIGTAIFGDRPEIA